jgi:hypothetical protein
MVSWESMFWYFVYVGLPFIAGLFGAWQAYKHWSRGEGIWKAFVVLTATAFIGVALISRAIALNVIWGWGVPWWATLGAGLAWFFLPLMVGSICLHKANELRKQQNAKWTIYFAIGTPLTFIIPAIGLFITWASTQTVIMCYAPAIPENWRYENTILAGMLLIKIYKEKKISKEVYEKIKRTLH